ncbi:Hypothetical predicted protein [Scomber scombrus]|uniref:Uncharacterized protein n=1 Tax=Scomber scombrus TaxID=13677 RepID=A0AAV1QD15_SCOSC
MSEKEGGEAITDNCHINYGKKNRQTEEEEGEGEEETQHVLTQLIRLSSGVPLPRHLCPAVDRAVHQTLAELTQQCHCTP